MSETGFPWSQYDQAYRHIHEKLAEILSQLSTVKDPSEYLPVRLSDGSQFYVAAGGAGGGLSQVQVEDSSGVWTDVGYASGDLSVPIQVQNAIDIVDRADRLLGKVYGSQSQQLKQRTSTYELIVQLAHAGAEIDPRQTRLLTAADMVTVDNQVLRDLDGHAQVDVLTHPAVAQSTRTNLKVQFEREDSVMKYFGNTFSSAGDYAVLSAVAGQKHKVYAFNYESSADVEVCLRDGADAARKFGVRTSKGVLAQTFIHPFVGSVNTVLNLRAEGAATVKGYVQYVTEA
jgi:hypothetical protein